MPRSTAVRHTDEDYLSIPVGTPGRHEIVGGELFVTELRPPDSLLLDWVPWRGDTALETRRYRFHRVR